MTFKKIRRIIESRKAILLRMTICAGILLIGILGWMALASMKQPPLESQKKERPLRVEVLNVTRKDVPVFITGYGEVKSLNVVTIAPEVSGKIIGVNARLETGEVIPKGEILFEVDPVVYQATFRESRATVNQWKNTIRRLKNQYKIDIERLKTIERNRDLAKAEYERIRQLFISENIGTRSGMEQAEQALNSAADKADQMAQTVLLYPIQIKEAESSLAAAKARLDIARINIERCTVTAPFDGRVKSVTLESGQYVSPGQNVLTLADDSILEIHVPLDSRDARKWLLFDDQPANQQTAWFSNLQNVTCEISWTEASNGAAWNGTLHRVVKFDRQTRTLTVAIRVDPENGTRNGPSTLPLVEGMFCSVKIPGKKLHQVIRLPRQAVSFNNTVFTAVGDRLKTVPVIPARVEGDYLYISGGLKENEMVIVTRLVDPLENSLLEITKIRNEGDRS